MAKQREATLTLFNSTSPSSKGPFHGEIEVHTAVPAGTKLKVHLYNETSAKGNAYYKGPCFTPVVP
jgi:hypothetical protein